MIAWVAARNDEPELWGRSTSTASRRNTAVRGPTQIEAQIDADPIISAQFTLWNQSGSKVVRGHLIAGARAEQRGLPRSRFSCNRRRAQFPAFRKKIIVATSTKIVWRQHPRRRAQPAARRRTVSPPAPTPSGPSPSPGASGSPGTSGSPGPTGAPTPPPSPSGPPPSGAIPPPPTGDVAAIVAYANFHFEQAQEALRAGDFALYGQGDRGRASGAGAPVPGGRDAGTEWAAAGIARGTERFHGACRHHRHRRRRSFQLAASVGRPVPAVTAASPGPRP